MRIKMEYVKYKYSGMATFLSGLASYIKTFSIIGALGLWIWMNGLYENYIVKKYDYSAEEALELRTNNGAHSVIIFIVAVFIVVTVVILLRKLEHEIAFRALLKNKLGRRPTREEVCYFKQITKRGL